MAKYYFGREGHWSEDLVLPATLNYVVPVLHREYCFGQISERRSIFIFSLPQDINWSLPNTTIYVIRNLATITIVTFINSNRHPCDYRHAGRLVIRHM